MLRYGLRGGGGCAPGAVPEMNDLDEVGGFIDPIVDQDRSVDELTDAGPSTGLPMYGKLVNRSRWFRMALPKRSAVAGK